MNDNFIETVNATIRNMDAVAAQNDAALLAESVKWEANRVQCNMGCGTMVSTCEHAVPVLALDPAAPFVMVLDNGGDDTAEWMVLVFADEDAARNSDAPLAQYIANATDAHRFCDVCAEKDDTAVLRDARRVVACDSCYENRPGHGDLADEVESKSPICSACGCILNTDNGTEFMGLDMCQACAEKGKAFVSAPESAKES